jgi:hypothetical protein
MREQDDRSLEPETGLDLLIRSSLETYGDPGPDSHLVQRVLARVASEGEGERARRAKRAHLLIGWGIALPVAACLIIAILFVVSKSLHNSANGTIQARVTPPGSTHVGLGGSIKNSPLVTSRHSKVAVPLRYLSHTEAMVTVQHLPKLDVFPVPQPLTHEEQAFAAYVARVPEAERKSLIDTEKQVDAPLSIAALEIQPIAPPDTGGN